MIKQLINVGNSKAVIIPKRLIEKFHLEKVIIQETEEGILLLPSTDKPSFQEKLENLRRNKKEIYNRMKKHAEDPKMISYYERDSLSEVDVDIID